MQSSNRLRYMRAFAAALVLGSGAAAMGADAVSVGNPWVRATVPGQSVAAAYMDLTAQAPSALVGAHSPIARKAELHTMSVDGGVMKMRALERLELPGKKTVTLAPGSHHVMLIGIRHQLKVGERVPLTLTLQDRKGVKSTVLVEAQVRAAGAVMEHKQPH